MTDLKKLAEEITSYYDLQLIDDSKLIEILERVQKESLAAQIVWPTEEESGTFFNKSYPGIKITDQEKLDIYCGFRIGISWLMANVKLKPVEPVSDEEIEALASDCYIDDGKNGYSYTQHYASGLEDGFKDGFRAAEKRLKGE